MKSKKQQGVLLIAIGHPQFIQMAFNLAATIKAYDRDVPIAVIHDDTINRLGNRKQIFDILIPNKNKGKGMEGAMALRTQLPKITPFQETISLDVDMAWLRKPISELFPLLDGCDFTFCNMGSYQIEAGENNEPVTYGWADSKETAEAYDLKGKLFQMRAEVILFRKTDAVKAMFADAADIRKSPKVKVNTLGGAVTEEFALQVAANRAGMEPHASPWNPTYWATMHRGLVPKIPVLYPDYYALSAGGSRVSPQVVSAYDILVGAACHKLGFASVYKLQSKRSYNSERRHA